MLVLKTVEVIPRILVLCSRWIPLLVLPDVLWYFSAPDIPTLGPKRAPLFCARLNPPRGQRISFLCFLVPEGEGVGTSYNNITSCNVRRSQTHLLAPFRHQGVEGAQTKQLWGTCRHGCVSARMATEAAVEGISLL